MDQKEKKKRGTTGVRALNRSKDRVRFHSSIKPSDLTPAWIHPVLAMMIPSETDLRVA
ncbi:MAG: hypothetical protein Q7S48_03650 [bacterium]|nr:hypothetical protein [bacterium]